MTAHLTHLVTLNDGELLEIFIDGSPEFGLFEVVGQAHDETGGASSFWVVDVNFIRTNTEYNYCKIQVNFVA